MTKKHLLKKAFTLTELLIVVIVLGVLAAVAVPKFSRVLETRKTAEAERILTSLRAEQEHRCVLGKEYHSQTGRTETLADAKNGKNYTYSLTRTGAKATSAKGYSIQMPSYKNGVLCCEGSYCNSLNKSYPSCDSVSVPQDECASPCSDCSCPEYAAGNRCACDAGYAAANPCECSPNSCVCSSYAAANPCECSPNSCACPSYAAAHSCECANECSCTENPHQEKCQNCSNATYAAAHRCECDASYAAANPCECAPNTCACSSYASANPCVCAPNTCACPSYAAAHPCECANECSCEENPNQEKCQNCSNATYAAAHPCECDAGYAEANPCECKGECVQPCDEASKPVSVENCGNCGSRTRTVTCNTATGQWEEGNWSECTGQGECAAGTTDTASCGGSQWCGKRTRTCSSSCQWGSWTDNCYEHKKDCKFNCKDTLYGATAYDSGMVVESIKDGDSCSYEGQEVYKLLEGTLFNPKVVYGPCVCECYSSC